MIVTLVDILSVKHVYTPASESVIDVLLNRTRETVVELVIRVVTLVSNPSNVLPFLRKKSLLPIMVFDEISHVRKKELPFSVVRIPFVPSSILTDPEEKNTIINTS